MKSSTLLQTKVIENMPAKQAADRVQELMNRKAELDDTLRKVVPIRPPPYLYTAANIERFQESLKEMFLSGDNSMTRNYLRFLVEGITVTDEQIETSARTDAALRLMAGGSRQEKTECVNHSVVSPTMGLAWLPLVDEFRTLCVAPTAEVQVVFEGLSGVAA